jgi:hypothetical protein
VDQRKDLLMKSRAITGVLAMRMLLAVIICTLAGSGWAELRPEFTGQWKAFRQQYPYHIQAVALSGAEPDGHRLLLISEPPPHVTVDGLRALDPRALANLEPGSNPIGVDGWAKDVLVDLPPMAQSDLQALLDSLANYLFFTSYKNAVMVLPVQPSQNGGYPLDVKASAADLNDALFAPAPEPKNETHFSVLALLVLFSIVCGALGYAFFLQRWVDAMRHPFRLRLILSLSAAALAVVLCAGYRFLPSQPQVDTAHSFISVEGGEMVRPEALLQEGRRGVYLSVQPGLVLWSFSRSVPLSQHPAEFRQFALDADLILGAVRRGDSVLVVGRERTVPIDLLPPLRAETMMVLAAAKTDELAQSYERTHVLAGKLPASAGTDQGKDWAPIYLSNELIDTEYGSLLNITDQLLKSWSMAGYVRYDGFKYPAPQKFPFEEQPVTEWAHTRNLTFNWNTKGAGSVTEDGPQAIYALNRTGALPIDYLAVDNSQLLQAEETAYDKFAGYSDPNLVRVVQYAALYQIFRGFEVADSSSSLNQETRISPVLKAESARLVKSIMTLSQDNIRGLAQRMQGFGLPDELIAKFMLKLALLRASLLSFQREEGSSGIERLASVLANRNAIQFAPTAETDKDMADIAGEITDVSMILQRFLPLDIVRVRNEYRDEQDGRRSSGWIRTPSIVQSTYVPPTPVDELHALTGGHNLSAGTVIFRPDTGVDRGHVDPSVDPVTRQPVIKYNPADVTKLSDLVRPAARNAEKPRDELTQILERQMTQPAGSRPPLRELIHYGGTEKQPLPRGFRPDLAPEVLPGVGWQRSEVSIAGREATLMNALSGPSAPAIIVSRLLQGGYSIAHSAAENVIQSPNLPAAIDAARSCLEFYDPKGPNRPTVYLTGFEERPGRSFLGTLDSMLDPDARENISIVAEGRVFKPEEVVRILNQDYDYNRATLENFSDPARETDGRWSVTADLKVPAVKLEKPGLLMRIKMIFKGLVEPAGRVLQAIRQVFQEWQASLGNLPDRVHILRAKRSLERRLRAVDPNISIETTFSETGAEGLDFYSRRRGQSIIHGAIHQPA